ncbi:peptidylglycine monooxygenase-like protein [Croceitalea sp. MTPC9]|uniref:6-bladed beta-propeller n=1 Tax=unclassified Croceitalea TaxID=2632280 RepID=UPI002B3D5567|nr:peptidylglycine monooxygenase-like protein [Croceitalea sp. MTPC6]GMN17376.1 peptidylglycine monooxygenase-like protein [Croceitalea sp. MTPC9]
MKRRNFIRNSSLVTAGLTSGLLNASHYLSYKDAIIGHNSHRYKIDLQWGALNSNFYPVNDCHEMVQDSKGRIILLTNHTKNNIIVYDRSGKLLEVWGTDYPGAHGLTLNVENGEDVLYIADNNRHEVIKTTIDGKVIQVFPYPKESGKYDKKESYIPTETAVATNGDVYVADGYGEQYIMHYNAKGELLNVFGGRGEENHLFNNAHGICIDDRDASKPTLLITARQQNKLKRFSLDGEYLSTTDLPGAYICRPVIHNKNVYLATIWSGNGSEGTGFISILNEENQLISAPGGCKPKYDGEQLSPMYQTLKVFQHPHDVCVDDDENLYVAQWNSGKTYPIKLYRV